MTHKSTLTKNVILVMLLAFVGNIQAQVFWSEDFADGFPTGWTSEDISANYDTEWTWCEGPVDPPAAGCSPIFAGAPNNQTVFQATSAENGFLTLNSDVVATNNHGGDPHISVLTTDAIDCSMETEVWLKFEAHIGAFELDPASNAILRVSNNGTDWTDYTIFPGLTATIRWSDNPEDVIVNITDVAASQETVFLQLQWTGGWEYFWNVDDMELSNINPTPPFDLRVSPEFYAIAPNARTPLSQIEAFGFLADVENVGSLDQDNVNLTVAIENDDAPGTTVFEETFVYDQIVSDTLIENLPFDGDGYTPPAEVGTYTGTYVINSENTDADSSDNVVTFDFEITENLFAKDRGANASFGSAEANWDDGENHTWAYGVHYHIVNGTDWLANEVTFGIGNADDDDIAGRNIAIRLYEWDDDDENGEASDEERTPVGIADYTITGDEGDTEDDLITVPLIDNLTLEQGVTLDDDTDYLVMLEYVAPDEVSLQFVGSSEYDYAAQALRSELIGAPRYGAMLGINHPLEDEPYTPGGFAGGGDVPIARLHLVSATSSTTALSEDNKIKVFPSPASDHINVSLELTELQEKITLRVVDATGRTISQRRMENVQTENYRFNVSSVPAGSYFLNVTSAAGTRSVPFTVAR